MAEPMPALEAWDRQEPLSETRAAITAPRWSATLRLAFRFVFSFLVLYNAPFPIGAVPGTGWLAEQYSRCWYAFVPWVGMHVLHLGHPILVQPGGNGSGDTTFDYVQMLCFAALALIAALIWTLVDRRSRRYPRLHETLRVYVRYVLGFTLLSYGMSKVIKLQFPFPSIDRLQEPFGESSPMGLLWTFMGYSTPYTFVAGAAEAAAGVLLFFRRTVTLGALLAAAVMTNVVMLNFCYDVPVKLYSATLLAMAVFLLAPDLRRLANVVVLNRPTLPVNLEPPFTGRPIKIARLALKTLLVGYALFSLTKQSWDGRRQYGELAPKPALYGVYEVEDFVRNGKAVPPLLTDRLRWRRLTVRAPQALSVRLMDESRQSFWTTYAMQSITLASGEKKIKQGVLTWSRPDQDHLILAGTLSGAALTAKLRRIDDSKYLLVSRGFHWINERPFNR